MIGFFPFCFQFTPSALTRHYAGDVLAMLPFHVANSAAYDAFALAYRAAYGSEPTPVAAYGYDAVHLVVSALEASGLNRAALRDAIAEMTDFVGATGAVSWDNAGGNRVEPVLLGLTRETRWRGAPDPQMSRRVPHAK